MVAEVLTPQRPDFIWGQYFLGWPLWRRFAPVISLQGRTEEWVFRMCRPVRRAVINNDEADTATSIKSIGNRFKVGARMQQQQHFPFQHTVKAGGWKNCITGETQWSPHSIRSVSWKWPTPLGPNLMVPGDGGDFHQLIRADVNDGPAAAAHLFEGCHAHQETHGITNK